jgi:hypothetical protein
VARRIEIELTSARPDGSWTWRAAGALNPRGVLAGSLLYEGVNTGDVVRAEAEFDMDGITVVSVEPPRVRERADANRIQLISRPPAPAVTTDVAAGRDRSHLNGRSERRRPSQPRLQPAGATAGRDGSAGGRGVDQGPQAGPKATPADRSPAERRARATGHARRELPERAELQGRSATGPGRAGQSRPSHGPHEGSGAGERRPAASRSGSTGGTAPARRAKRLSPGNVHRSAMLESLPLEQQPIAQQLLRGGIPAVRTALHFERERAREEGRPEPSAEGVLALAESLAPRVKAAEWRDRAEAALKAGDDLSMRDLRSLVTGSDVARDEASREVAVSLREMLERRIDKQWAEWQQRISADLDAGQVARALRWSSRPPDLSPRFPAELATRLRDAASAAMSADTPSDRWLALLQVVVDSPVRRTVKPAGLPTNPTPELLEAARQQCGRVPALAALLGISVPPPPAPSRPSASRPSAPRRTFGTPARAGSRSVTRRAKGPKEVRTRVADKLVAVTAEEQHVMPDEPVTATAMEQHVVAEEPLAEAEKQQVAPAAPAGPSELPDRESEQPASEVAAGTAS